MARAARRSPAKRKTRSKTKTTRHHSGLAAIRGGGHAHEDDGVCGCDLDFNEGEATPDASLPMARGGVEVVTARGPRA